MDLNQIAMIGALARLVADFSEAILKLSAQNQELLSRQVAQEEEVPR